MISYRQEVYLHYEPQRVEDDKKRGVWHENLTGTVLEEREEILLAGNVKKVASGKKEHRGAHVEERHLVSRVITRRRVVNHHQQHRDELDVVEPNQSFHSHFYTTNYANRANALSRKIIVEFA